MNDMQNLNGYIFTTDRGIYRLPPELLQTLLSHFDHETLLNCQLVCKSWLEDIRNEVWRMKTEMKFGKKLLRHNFSWRILYFMCKTENPFEENLLKNHSGEIGFQYWNFASLWAVENPPYGVSELPVDPIFEGNQFCFATSDGKKSQTVKLVDAGFHPYILDKLRLSIEISEWYCGPKDLFKKIYYELRYINKRPKCDDLVLKETDVEQENEWIKKTYSIENDEKGLREIDFVNFGKTIRKSGGQCRIAGSCLKVKFPCITTSGSSRDSSNDL